MILAATLTMIASFAAVAVAPRRVNALPPATATTLLVGSMLCATLATVYVLGAFAFTWIAQIPQVAKEGDWSPLLLRSADPVPATVAISAGVALSASVTWIVRAVVEYAKAHQRLHRSLNRLSHDGGVIIVDSSRPDAYATPLAGGRVVVTRGLLEALGPDESRALLAHERAHLKLRHHWCTLAAKLCAAANPLLRPIADAVGESVERWADERAARVVQDRRLVARALARAALHTHSYTPPSGALAAVDGQVPRRVHALLDPPPRLRFVPIAVVVVLLVSVVATTTVVGRNTDAMLDKATISSP
jgi:Zn-dependent protease with chaperone function